MKPALIALSAFCLGCLAAGPSLALPQQSADGDLMLFPPSVAPMTPVPAAPAAQLSRSAAPAAPQPRSSIPAAQQPGITPTQPAVTKDFVEPPPATPSHAAVPTAENAPPLHKPAVSPPRRYVREWRHRGYRHYSHYAGGYRRNYAGGGYAPSPLGILSLPFVAVGHLLGQ